MKPPSELTAPGTKLRKKGKSSSSKKKKKYLASEVGGLMRTTRTQNGARLTLRAELLPT